MTLGGYFDDFRDILEHVWSIFQYLDPMGHQNEPQGLLDHQGLQKDLVWGTKIQIESIKSRLWNQ